MVELRAFFGVGIPIIVNVEQAQEGAMVFILWNSAGKPLIEVLPSCWSSCSVSLERQMGKTNYWYCWWTNCCTKGLAQNILKNEVKTRFFGPPPGRILYLEILRFPSFSISITLRFMRQNVFQVFFPGNSVRFTSKWFAEATVWTSSQRNDGMLCVSSRDHPQFAFAALLLIILRFIFLYPKKIESEKHWAVLFLLGEDVVKTLPFASFKQNSLFVFVIIFHNLNEIWFWSQLPPKVSHNSEKWWLEDYYPFGKVSFQGRTVKLQGCKREFLSRNLFHSYFKCQNFADFWTSNPKLVTPTTAKSPNTTGLVDFF